ncbi:MAG: hypothetical protein HQK75_20355, partial [Candidatus Magnetomorum sp.]|nr:hypothetical protein [Candidatus Magnetomorum sp.]
MKKNPTQSMSNLRTRAEKVIQEKPENLNETSEPDIQKLFHELHVHQIELELQNEELRLAQKQSEETQKRYFDLYDLAPVGYFTLTKTGQIIEINLTGADLLGIERKKIINTWLRQFILPEDQDTFYFHLNKCFESHTRQTCELKMKPLNEIPFYAQIESVADQNDNNEKEIFLKLTMTNIDKLKQAQACNCLTIDILSQINQINETEELIRNIIILIKTFSGMEAVGIRLKEGDDYPYFFTSGFSSNFIQTENHLCVSGVDGKLLRDATGNPVLECMCGNVLCNRTHQDLPFFTANGSFWTHSTSQLLASTSEKDRQSRTRNRCNGEGYESVALIPIHSGQDIIGLIQLNDRRKNMLFLDRIHFLEGIANSIGIALHRKTVMKEKEILAEQLRHSQKIEAIGTMAGGIAHDFNNILGVILGNTEIVLYSVTADNPSHLPLSEVRDASLRARTLIRQMLDFSHKELKCFMKGKKLQITIEY